MMMRAATFLGKFMGWTIRAYQLLVAPLLLGSCRFYPSCSEYARQTIAEHGPLSGGWLALKRICRCHPWGGSGVDPVPAAAGDETRQVKRCAAGRHD
jgi:uncharacterized protein